MWERPRRLRGCALSRVLQACYDKLTQPDRDMKLGELMTTAETAAAFCRESARNALEAVLFDHETWRAMSRPHAKRSGSPARAEPGRRRLRHRHGRPGRRINVKAVARLKRRRRHGSCGPEAGQARKAEAIA